MIVSLMVMSNSSVVEPGIVVPLVGVVLIQSTLASAVLVINRSIIVLMSVLFILNFLPFFLLYSAHNDMVVFVIISNLVNIRSI